MFNEIELAVVAVLADDTTGLPGDGGAPWHVPADHIGRQPPDLSGAVSNRLPAVAFALAEFSVVEGDFAGLGEVRPAGDGADEIRAYRLDLLCRLDVWAEERDDAQAIIQRALELLLAAREELEVEAGDYRLARVRPLLGRALPVEEHQSTLVYRRQIDCRIEGELLITTHHTPIEEVIIERVEWEIDGE